MTLAEQSKALKGRGAGLQCLASTDFEAPEAVAALAATGCCRASFLADAPLEAQHTQWVLDTEVGVVLKDTIAHLQRLREHLERAFSCVDGAERDQKGSSFSLQNVRSSPFLPFSCLALR
jgi:hypothetical protein